MVHTIIKRNPKSRTCADCPHTSHDFHRYQHLHPSSSQQRMSLRGGGSNEEDTTKKPSPPKRGRYPPKPTVEDVPEPVNDNNGNGKHLSGHEITPGEVIKLVDGTEVTFSLKKKRGGEYLLRGDQVSNRGGSGGDENENHAEDDGIYEDSASILALQRRNLESLKHGKEETNLLMDAEEFYRILYFSKVEEFLQSPEMVTREEKERMREGFDVWICGICGGYIVLEREGEKQVVEERRVLMCGGECGVETSKLRGGAGDEDVFLRLLDEHRDAGERGDISEAVKVEEVVDFAADSPEQFLRMLDEVREPLFLSKKTASIEYQKTTLETNQISKSESSASSTHYSRTQDTEPVGMSLQNRDLAGFKIMLKESGVQITNTSRILICRGCEGDCELWWPRQRDNS